MNIGVENTDRGMSRAEWLFYSKNVLDVSFICKYLLRKLLNLIFNFIIFLTSLSFGLKAIHRDPIDESLHKGIFNRLYKGPAINTVCTVSPID